MEEARRAVAEADASMTQAEAAFSAGSIQESALHVRAQPDAVSRALLGLAAVRLTLLRLRVRVFAALQDALNAKDNAQLTLDEAEGKVEAATVALESALSEETERIESRKCVLCCVVLCVSVCALALLAALARRLVLTPRLPRPARRSSRSEPSAPERASARVASRPKKTYAEDEAFSDDDEFRDGGLGAWPDLPRAWPPPAPLVLRPAVH